MSTENLAEQFEAEEQVAEAVEEQQPEAVAEPTPEEQARVFGWRPKDEFSGPDDKWVDAEAFLKAREENLGIAKQDNKRLSEVNRDLTKKLRRMETMIEQIKGFEQRAYERALNDLKAQQRAAVETGDTDAFERIDGELDELRKSAATEEKKPVQDVDTQEMFAEWLADNDWYIKDEVKRTYAEVQVNKLGPMQDYADGPEAYLQEIAERVNKRFAAKEEAKTPAKKINPVAGANAMRTGQRAAKGYADLDAAGKQMAKQMVSMKIFENEEAYAKEYWKNA